MSAKRRAGLKALGFLEADCDVQQARVLASLRLFRDKNQLLFKARVVADTLSA